MSKQQIKLYAIEVRDRLSKGWQVATLNGCLMVYSARRFAVNAQAGCLLPKENEFGIEYRVRPFDVKMVKR